jgi:hypothetical protein
MALFIRKRTSFVLFLLLLAPLLLSLERTTAAENKVVVVPLIDTVKGVPKTGQTKCYSDDVPNAEILCDSTGQDGELQKGIVWPNPRFKDNLNGTVTDNLTGLAWLKNADCLNGVRNRTEALQFAGKLFDGYGLPAALLDCGLSDGSTAGQWRLPNRFELESLLDLSQVDPALPPGHPFTNVRIDNYYWTSSYHAFFFELRVGWTVNFSSGDVTPRSWVLDADKCYVWPVRDGS